MTAVNTKNGNCTTCRRQRGFTLIELMIVMAIVGILASIAVPNYQWTLIRAREAVLQENLYGIRSAIDQFYADSGKFPDTLNDLSDKRYLHAIPRDPFTGKNDTWVVVPPPQESSTEASSSSGSSNTAALGAVYDVQSGSNLIGSNGKPYSEW